MKKTLATLLALVIVCMALMACMTSVLAEGNADAVTSASVKETDGNNAYTAPTTTTTPATKPVTTATPTTASTNSKVEFYTVVSGDKLWKIAAKHNLTLEQLLALNPTIKNANKIKIGQKIIVKVTPVVVVAPSKPVTTPVAVTTPTVTVVPKTVKLYQGLGSTQIFRVRGTAYSFNVTMATAVFDVDGKVVNAYIDTYEVSQSANFAGWPGVQEAVTVDTLTKQVSEWKTKRELGDDYNMKSKATTGNEWYVQMNNYQKFFVGKTVAEIRTWFDKSTNASGKPIVSTTTNADELAKLDKLTEQEKKQLVDVVSGATMSLSDSHGLFIEALEEAYKNRVEFTVTVK